MRKTKYGDEARLRAFVEQSRSFSEVARRCGYKNGGGSQKHLVKVIARFGIDVSHFSGQGWAAGKSKHTDVGIAKMSLSHDSPWDDIFTRGSKTKLSVLMRRLIDSGRREYVCDVCHISNWNGFPLRLQLDHIDGDRENNQEHNLRFLCPNCHSQTPTFSRGLRPSIDGWQVNWWKEMSLPSTVSGRCCQPETWLPSTSKTLVDT